ncbi:MAG: hypothetical protein IPL83_10800 [Bdellovibrionales bacterium]|nr:hypothetical protein [Bdellovibrionales bacterium]
MNKKIATKLMSSLEIQKRLSMRVLGRGKTATGKLGPERASPIDQSALDLIRARYLAYKAAQK